MARRNTNNTGLSNAHGLGERLLSPTGFGIFPWQTDAV
jgi:hypothetical protein